MIAILIADVMLALLSRMAPQMHVFDLSMSVKNLLFSGLMVVYLMFLTPLMMQQLAQLQDRVGLLRLLAP